LERVSASVHLSRASRLADLARPYEVVVDGQIVGEIRNNTSIEVAVAPGPHSLQVRLLTLLGRRPGRSSSIVRFEAIDRDRLAFVCYSPSYPRAAWQWLAPVLGSHDRWITLEAAD
jgi:hypothetical protein